MSEKQQLARTTAHWYKECEQLQEKVSLLEMKLSFERERIRELQAFEVANVEMAQRIAKAREILQSFNLATCDQKIIDALWALEGK